EQLNQFKNGVLFTGLFMGGAKALETAAPWIKKGASKVMDNIEKNVNKFGKYIDDLVPAKAVTPDGQIVYVKNDPMKSGGGGKKVELNKQQKDYNKAVEESKNGNKGVIEPKPLANGPYIKNGKPKGRSTLSGEKKLQFEKDVYNNNVDPDGILRDPNTGDTINWKPGQSRKNKVDFGHKSGYSYKDIFTKYKNGEITLDELKEFQFNQSNYRLETPSANRSHKYE
ncbi:GH-E family nuclease, partial [Clostridium estertheticum]|uniref:GH-E family nuclease n=1 Tax=Clostridium estertheticum TaxID=238834 RepID=UPI001CF32A8B